MTTDTSRTRNPACSLTFLIVIEKKKNKEKEIQTTPVGLDALETLLLSSCISFIVKKKKKHDHRHRQDSKPSLLSNISHGKKERRHLSPVGLET
jgi:hypothetical protein